MSLLDRVNDEYLKRDTITCEKCQHVNVLAGKNVSKRTKRAHMVYSDDATWYGLRSGCASLGMTMGEFLAFLHGLWQREHNNVSSVSENYEGVNPRNV